MVYNVGLIGLGKVGAFYDINNQNIMSHIKAIIGNKKFHLSFAYDPDITKCDIIRNKYNLSNIHTKLTDLNFKQLDIDLLVIASPTNTHFETIISLLEISRPNIILCEKPLTTSFKDLQILEKICRKRKIKLVTNFMRRSLPVIKRIKEKIHLEETSTHFVPVCRNRHFGVCCEVISKEQNKIPTQRSDSTTVPGR